MQYIRLSVVEGVWSEGDSWSLVAVERDESDLELIGAPKGRPRFAFSLYYEGNLPSHPNYQTTVAAGQFGLLKFYDGQEFPAFAGWLMLPLETIRRITDSLVMNHGNVCLTLDLNLPDTFGDTFDDTFEWNVQKKPIVEVESVKVDVTYVQRRTKRRSESDA